ncbi:hypothetical protein NDU88_000935 [Pleurodeles waltl]|uniref:Uncharacterized protein n=1 Tax=Pleurodeles waltl TaxID=8319 RepID=A0AAV7VYD5_PLEWA|nr:hypothetical protein NDU88_000935 [Pleurodeles waltl]
MVALARHKQLFYRLNEHMPLLTKVWRNFLDPEAYTAATARHDASEQADASCPRLPVVGATRSDRGRGQAVARETGWISRRGEFKREDGTDRGGERRRAETKEYNAEEERQEEDVENRSPEETQEEQERRDQEEQERRDQEEQEQERRDQEEQEQERRAQEKERRAQEKERRDQEEQEQERRAQEKERRAQEKERRAQEKERRAQEKERRDQEKETPQETEGEETPSEERYNASHDPGGSWLTKIPPEGTARRLPGKEPLQLYQLDRHYRNCTATPKENPDT